MGSKGGEPLSGWHEPDVGRRPAFRQHVAPAIAVIGAVGTQSLTRADTVIHIGRRLPVMGLTFGQFQQDRAAQGIDQSMRGSFSTSTAGRAATSRTSAMQSLNVGPPSLAYFVSGGRPSAWQKSS